MVPLVLMLSRACSIKEEGQAVGARMPDWADSLLRVLTADDSTATRWDGRSGAFGRSEWPIIMVPWVCMAARMTAWWVVRWGCPNDVHTHIPTPPLCSYTKTFVAKAILHVEARVEGTRQRQELVRQRRAALRRRAAMASAASSSLDAGAISSDSLSLVMAAAGGDDVGWGRVPPGPGGGTRAIAAARDDPSALVSSGTVFSSFSHLFFPAILDVLLPPTPTDGLPREGDQEDATDGSEARPENAPPLPSQQGSNAAGSFHYVLRDLCVVLLTAWGGVFERAAVEAGGLGQGRPPRLLHHDLVAPSATRLLRHLVLVSASPSPYERKANVDTYRMLLGKWGAAAQASVSDFLDLLQPRRRRPKGTGQSGQGGGGGEGAPDAKRPRQSADSAGGGGGSRRVSDDQLLVSLKLLSVALYYGQGDQLLRQEDAGQDPTAYRIAPSGGNASHSGPCPSSFIYVSLISAPPSRPVTSQAPCGRRSVTSPTPVPRATSASPLSLSPGRSAVWRGSSWRSLRRCDPPPFSLVLCSRVISGLVT